MSKYQKSVKDKAFDEERAKLNKRIRELEYQLRVKNHEIQTMKDSHEKDSHELEQLRDWNRRLLEYMDMTEEEMRGIICKEKSESEIFSAFTKLAMALHQYKI